jgi:protoporphyrinogen/coproporphyrinogen III oxidase
LSSSTAVDIQVVNLWYPKTDVNPFRGFGYLIPNSVPIAPVDQNPENALGVLFDSDRESILPTSVKKPHAQRHRSGSEGDTLPGTKLTVMLGGEHWSGMPKSFLPDEKEGAKLAQSVVQRSLGIDPSERVFASAKMARNCIPQHLVGHFDRMARADGELQAAFKGKLAVAGTSYTAQGVLPALRAGRDIAKTVQVRSSAGQQWVEAEPRDPQIKVTDVGDTGLLRFRNNRAAWRLIPHDARLPPVMNKLLQRPS